MPLVVAVAQPVCIPGDVLSNAKAHANVILSAGAQFIVFPELSMTGYEPDAPALTLDDHVFGPIVDACAASGSVALVGAPVRGGDASYIASVAVTSAGAEIAYAKTSLGGREVDVFTPGPGPATLVISGWRVGLGICKDTRMADHIESTLALGPDLYVAGLVHHPHELADQDGRAARITTRGRIPVGFASAAGRVGSAYPQTAGHSCIWSEDGVVLARAGGTAGEVAVATIGGNHAS